MAGGRAPVRRSLIRKIIWAGGDRRLIGLGALVCGSTIAVLLWGLGLAKGLLLTLAVPVPLMLLVVWGARQMNAKDGWMWDVTLRYYLGHKNQYFAPQPSVGKEHPQVNDFTKNLK